MVKDEIDFECIMGDLEKNPDRRHHKDGIPYYQFELLYEILKEIKKFTENRTIPKKILVPDEKYSGITRDDFISAREEIEEICNKYDVCALVYKKDVTLTELFRHH